MSVSHKLRESLMTVCLLVSVFCVSTVFGEDDSRDVNKEAKDKLDSNQRELREYLPEAWRAVQNIPEGSTGWIPRDPIENQSGVVSGKRRRLRKRKRRPPVVSFVDESVEIIQPTKNFEEETESAHSDSAERPKNQIAQITDRFSQEEEFIPLKQRKRPNIRDPWDEMQEESVKPYVRRKVTPAYQASEESDVIPSLSASIQFGSSENINTYNKNPNQNTDEIDAYYEKPKKTKKKEQYNAEHEESNTTTRKTPHNLKAILKQNGGLSLSEILQKKNITLSELLMGKQEAIKALTEPSSTHASFSPNPISSSTQKNPSFTENYEVSKYKRLPPSIALKKEHINRRYEQYGESHESLTDKELYEAQKKRMALLQGHTPKISHNSKFSEVTRYEVVTEPTTEKRIFVPAHPKLYTSVDYKPELPELETHTESYTNKYDSVTTQKTSETTPKSEFFTTQRTKSVEPSLATPKLRLPITSAKLNKMISKKVLPTKASSLMEEENYPQTAFGAFKPMKISIKEILKISNMENEPEEKVSDEPFRMSIDLDTIPDKHSINPTFTNAPSISNSKEPTSSPTTTTVTPETPKLKPFSAKDEILEIIKDPQGRARLAKILEERNMTLQELIDQRERGSSHLHLADIFHNKTKEPEPLEEAFEGRISSEVFTSFPVFARRPKVLIAPEEKSTQKPEETTSQTNNVVITGYPSFKIEVPKDLPREGDKSKQTFPWKQLYPDLFNIQNKNKEEAVILPEVPEISNNDIEEVQITDILTQEDLERRIFSSVSSEQLNTADEDTHKIVKIPSGVQSAIIASLVIVGLSLMVFMTILVVFRWTQKQKTKLNYCDSLKPPLFEGKPQNIKTFVAETLGKTKTKYYKNNLQSMSDSVWERKGHGKVPF